LPEDESKMNTVPQIVPVSELRNKHGQIFGLLHKGPVVLAQRSRPAAVLVSVEQWNELQHYKHLALLDERSKRIDRGEFLTQEEVENDLKERGLL
jgi:prevent-host-death family protein